MELAGVVRAGLGQAGTMGTGIQMQDSRALLEQLLQVARMSALEEMASGIAHELNQPIGAITTFAQAGQRIHRGDLIGLMGSTGRSTGSHLHYEVRIDGRAVNPVPFLQASSTFIAMQRGVGAPVAVGGPAGGSR